MLKDVYMKLIIKEERLDILKEGVSEIVFHFTSVVNLVKILKTGKMFLSHFVGDSYAEYNNMFYLSFTRVRDGRFGYSEGKKVRIEFDGRKLNADFKGQPINYWGNKGKSSYMSEPSNRAFNPTDLTPNQIQSRVESEDRIISTQDSFDISKYVKRIDVLFNERDMMLKRELKEAVKLSKSYDFPLEIFSNMNDFNKRTNPITVDFEGVEGEGYGQGYGLLAFENNLIQSLVFVLYGNGDVKDNMIDIMKKYGLENYINDHLFNRVSNLIKDISIYKFSREFSEVIRFVSKMRGEYDYDKVFKMIYDYIKKNKINDVYKILLSKTNDRIYSDTLSTKEINFYVYNNRRILDLDMNILDIIFASDFIEFMQRPEIMSKHKSKSDESYVRYLYKLVDSDFLKFKDLLSILKSVGGMQFLSDNGIQLTGVTADEIDLGDYVPYNYGSKEEYEEWRNKMLKKYIK